jgi:hypothetical protein
MSNGPIKPPIVWHLDTDEIEDQTNSPPDRLTAIKNAMIEFQEGKRGLQETLLAIENVCNPSSPQT